MSLGVQGTIPGSYLGYFSRKANYPNAHQGLEFLERVFRLFDLDRDNVLVQEDWVEFLKERLTLPVSNKCGRRMAATRTDFIRVLIEQRCAARAATTWNTLRFSLWNTGAGLKPNYLS
uniref:EF-hand domain-containing protein n=1 Tax=Timema monikensis TaxID=170555 RepID=A0A7R9E427_9NEOP|nr:unnamed protein product [Timema monikensis]